MNPDTWHGEVDDRRSELRLRAVSIPAALVMAIAFHGCGIGHMLQRTFLTMMVHEVGHAVTAWLCGLPAVPWLWVTWIGDARSVLVVLAVAAANAGAIGYGRRSGRPVVLATGVALALLQLVGTLGLSPRAAQALVLFAGDGGAMVLGTALIATFYARRDSQIYTGWLRWGFLVIGAAAFVDTFATWWAARTSWDAIPFGENEGVGLSDPSKLTDVYGWATQTMVARYVALGVACLVVLAAVWAWGLRRARAELAVAERDYRRREAAEREELRRRSLL